MDSHFTHSFPDVMRDKTILYVHGFASSGQSGTVSSLRQLLSESRIIAPDLPIHPSSICLPRDSTSPSPV